MASQPQDVSSGGVRRSQSVNNNDEQILQLRRQMLMAQANGSSESSSGGPFRMQISQFHASPGMTPSAPLSPNANTPMPPSYRQIVSSNPNQQQQQTQKPVEPQIQSAMVRNSPPEAQQRTVQAVQPFGIRESLQAIPKESLNDTQMLKQLAREADSLVSAQQQQQQAASQPRRNHDGPPQTFHAQLAMTSATGVPSHVATPPRGLPTPFEALGAQNSAKFSLSQPDLSRVYKLSSPSRETRAPFAAQMRPGIEIQSLSIASGQNIMVPPSAADAAELLKSNAGMINFLAEQNQILRSELDGYIRKTYKLQQLELQYQRIQREYEDLMRRQEKRETLEKEVQQRLGEECRRLRERNQQLREHLDRAMAELEHRQNDYDESAAFHAEITKRDMLLSNLLAQSRIKVMFSLVDQLNQRFTDLRPNLKSFVMVALP